MDSIGAFELESLKALRQENAPAFRQQMLEELSWTLAAPSAKPPGRGTVAGVALFLRAAPQDSLADFGIEWQAKPDDTDYREDVPWQDLRDCLLEAERDDALLILERLARSVEGQEPTRAGDLIEAVLSRPQWREEAIRAFPALFRAGQRAAGLGSERAMGEAQHKRNAFHLLASMATTPDDDGYELTLRALEALRDVGVPALRTKVGNQSMLDVAAGRRYPGEVLRAFAEFFAQDVNRVNGHDRMPLHYAAAYGMADNVRALVAAGAVVPGPDERVGVLAEAISSNSPQTVLAVLESCSCTAQQFEQAMSWHRNASTVFNGALKEDEMRQIFQVVQARQVTAQALDEIHDHRP